MSRQTQTLTVIVMYQISKIPIFLSAKSKSEIARSVGTLRPEGALNVGTDSPRGGWVGLSIGGGGTGHRVNCNTSVSQPVAA